ncbi:MAG: hypothetical protein WD270_10150 [Acetobacterales bacterium]
MRPAGKALRVLAMGIALGAVAGCGHFHDPVTLKEANHRLDHVLGTVDYRKEHRDDAGALSARTDWTRVRTVDVTIADRSFLPTYLYLRPNTPYRLAFRNATDRPYTVQARRLFKESAVRPAGGEVAAIDNFSIAAGETATVDVVSDMPGEYPLAATGDDAWFWGTIGVVEVR